MISWLRNKSTQYVHDWMLCLECLNLWNLILQTEHQLKWEQIRNSQSSTDPGSEPTEVPSETELWVQANYNKKGRVYGLGSEEVKLKHLVKSTATSRDRDQDPDVWATVTQLNSELSTMAEKNRHLEEKVTLLTSELSGTTDTFREFMRA